MHLRFFFLLTGFQCLTGQLLEYDLLTDTDEESSGNVVEIALGQVCPSNVSDTCTDDNAECSNGTCQCKEDYYDGNGNILGGTCIPKKELGDVCEKTSTMVTASVPCLDVNARCANSDGGYTCLCIDDYYDDNGDAAGGYCIPHCGSDDYNCINHRLLVDITNEKDDLQKLQKMVSFINGKNRSFPLNKNDVEAINNIIRNVIKTITLNSTTWQKASQNFIDIVDVVIGEETAEAWKEIINYTGSGIETTIHTLDLFVEKLANIFDEIDEPIVFSKSNLYLLLGYNKKCIPDIDFPDKNGSMAPAWTNAHASIHVSCDNDDVPTGSSFHFLQDQKYCGSLYRNINQYFSTDVIDNKFQWTLNTAHLGFSFFSKLASNVSVTISFQVDDGSLRNPQCSYWKISNSVTGAGNWSTDGCRLQRYSVEEGTVVCMCDHLTNFAVLMSPLDITDMTDHVKALSIISLVGCIISMLCLVLTVAVYIFFWRTLKSERSLVLVHLCLALFCGYLVFLNGINQTSNKVVCTAMSAVLQYIFLVVFWLMFAQGIVLGSGVLLPFSKKKLAIPLIVAAYVLPMIIVGITMTATQCQGYGNEKSCWLDVDSGLIWTFLGPVLSVILFNGIIIVVAITMMLKTSNIEKRTNMEKTKAALKGFCVLLPVMGVTWIFGILSVSKETVIFQYLFAILNSLQGLLILVFNCILDKKVRAATGTLGTYGSGGDTGGLPSRKFSSDTRVSVESAAYV